MFAVSAAVLITVRPLGPVWLALIVAAVLGTSTGLRDRMGRTLRAPGARWTGGLLTLSLIAAGTWDLTQNTMGMIPETAPGYTLAKGAYITMFQTPGFLAQMLGTIGWIDVRVPTLTTMFWYGAIAALLLLSLVLGNRRERVVLLALTALIVLFPIAFEAYAGTGYGVGWQGRYDLPLAVRTADPSVQKSSCEGCRGRHGAPSRGHCPRRSGQLSRSPTSARCGGPGAGTPRAS